MSPLACIRGILQREVALVEKVTDRSLGEGMKMPPQGRRLLGGGPVHSGGLTCGRALRGVSHTQSVFS